MAALTSMKNVMDHPMPTDKSDLLIGLAGAAIIYAIVFYKKKNPPMHSVAVFLTM
jgi:hypothetical protein